MLSDKRWRMNVWERLWFYYNMLKARRHVSMVTVSDSCWPAVVKWQEEAHNLANNVVKDILEARKDVQYWPQQQSSMQTTWNPLHLLYVSHIWPKFQMIRLHITLNALLHFFVSVSEWSSRTSFWWSSKRFLFWKKSLATENMYWCTDGLKQRSAALRMWPFRGSMRKQRWLWLITSRPRQEVFFQEQKKAWLTKMKLPGDRVEKKERWREGKWDTFILCD